MGRKSLGDRSSEQLSGGPHAAYEHLARRQLDMNLEFRAKVRAGDTHFASHWHIKTGN